MQKLTESIIVDIIQRQLGLPELNVWIRDQNRKVPNDTGFYIIVGMRDSYVVSANKPYLLNRDVDAPVSENSDRVFQGENRVISYSETQTLEINECQLMENIQIDIISRSDSAIRRKHEIINALNSFYSKQQQDKYFFKIQKLPNSFVNTSHAEGGSQLNRFSLNFACLSWFKDERVLASNGGLYYDDFETRVDDAKSIETPAGIIEFSIPS